VNSAAAPGIATDLKVRARHRQTRSARRVALSMIATLRTGWRFGIGLRSATDYEDEN